MFKPALVPVTVCKHCTDDNVREDQLLFLACTRQCKLTYGWVLSVTSVDVLSLEMIASGL